MRRSILLGLLMVAGAVPVGCAAEAYMAGEGIAVFYPDGFKPEGTLPSFIFAEEPGRTGRIPPDWMLVPEFSSGNGKAVMTLPLEEGVDLYGNGEVTGPLRRNGTEVTLWNTDNYGYGKHDGTRLYQSHPWVMGVRPDGTSFGIIADNTWRQRFDLSGSVTIESDGPPFRVIVIERASPVELMKTLGELTGTMDLPPLWALGFQQCRYSYYPDARVKEIAREFRERRIPCDVIWMDIDYMDQYKVFTFSDAGFPDPQGLNRYLHERDFKSIYMIDPGIGAEKGYFVYDQGRKGNHFVLAADGSEFNGDVWPGACAFPDFTRPETCAWWASLYPEFMALGIDGVWNDMNEPSVFNGPDGTMPEDNIHRGGGGLPAGSHLRYHNVYGLMMVRASREGIMQANPEKRPFVLSRSNFLGGQRYAATWTGDNKSTWEHLKLSIPMSLNLSLSGQPFNGPDIGGFIGDCTPDLIGHWMALGAYYPFSRNHTEKGGTDQEPWAFGEEIEQVCRTAIGRRYRLMPYLYTLFREAAVTGVPVMRPVFFADDHDPALRDEQQTFLLGPDLLVVPRWSANVDFPTGDWDRVMLEEEDDGYQPYLLLRPGAVVPMGPVVQSTEDYSTARITLLVNPDADGGAEGTLYHDSGDGYGYQTGAYSLHCFKASSPAPGRLRIEVQKTGGDLDIQREYQIGLVTDDAIVYSDWSAGPVLDMEWVPDRISTVDRSLFASMYVAGSFNDWNAAGMPLNHRGDGQWQSDRIRLEPGRHALLFSESGILDARAWGGVEGLSGTASSVAPNQENGLRFTVDEAGDYVISFDEQTGSFTIGKPAAFEYLSIVGDATSIGWNPAGIPLEQSADNPNVFTWSGPLSEGEFKFHTSSGGWGEGYWINAAAAGQSPSEGEFIITTDNAGPDNKWRVKNAGEYSVVINVEDHSLEIDSLEEETSASSFSTE